jgi:hypothetical protein
MKTIYKVIIAIVIVLVLIYYFNNKKEHVNQNIKPCQTSSQCNQTEDCVPVGGFPIGPKYCKPKKA